MRKQHEEGAEAQHFDGGESAEHSQGGLCEP